MEKEMTLVPIIYTSLMISGAVLFLVITISYIAYKAKGNSRSRNPQGQTDYRNHQITVIPRTNNTRNFQTVPIPVTVKQAVTRINMEQAAMYNSRTNRYVSNISNQTKSFDNKNNNQKRVGRDTYSNNYTNYDGSRHSKRTTSTRIEVMNHSDRFNTSPAKYEEIRKPVYAAQNLSELNLINLYSDNSDMKFVTLTALPASRVV